MKFTSLIMFGAIFLSFASCKKSSNTTDPVDPTTNKNKKWNITQNNLTVDGSIFTVKDTDAVVFNNSYGSMTVGEGQYFTDPKGPRFILYNVNSDTKFEKGQIIGGTDFEGQDVWEFQYDPIDGSGNWTIGLQASNIDKVNQGTIMISDMKESSTNIYGVSMMEFTFDDLLVADTYTSQGTGTQGTNTQGTVTISTFKGLIRIEYK